MYILALKIKLISQYMQNPNRILLEGPFVLSATVPACLFDIVYYHKLVFLKISETENIPKITFG